MLPISQTAVTADAAKKLIVIVGAVFFALSGVSLFWSLRLAGSQYRTLAVHTARAISETVTAARDWNAFHGGVYAPAHGRMQPNPYLDLAGRDIHTEAGVLTKINPAFMTRQLSELLSGKKGVQLRLISDRPINPVNKPDPWERQALQGLAKSGREAYAVDEAGAPPAFRYMTALVTRASCLQCHAKQGYKEGDIRGGLSITFSYAPFAAAAQKTRLFAACVHGFLLTGAAALMVMFGRNLFRSIATLQDALAHIKTLEGLLPTCCNCGRIRKEHADVFDQTSWVRFEQYIAEKTDATFSHGICPECAQRLYPELYKKMQNPNEH